MSNVRAMPLEARSPCSKTTPVVGSVVAVGVGVPGEVVLVGVGVVGTAVGAAEVGVAETSTVMDAVGVAVSGAAGVSSSSAARMSTTTRTASATTAAAPAVASRYQFLTCSVYEEQGARVGQDRPVFRDRSSRTSRPPAADKKNARWGGRRGIRGNG
jgi:hypothetical protein